MFNSVQDYTIDLWKLGRKTKQSQGGWLSGNAVCCHHNGHNADTKGRGGIKTNGSGGISYHCFNCKFKTSYTPGLPLSFKFRKLLNWMGADANDVQRLVIEAMRVKDLIRPEEIKAPPEDITFDAQPLPKEATNFLTLAEFYALKDWQDVPNQFLSAVDYVYGRNISMEDYEFFWTPEVEHKLNHRIIIPFIYQGKTYGYTARAIVDGISPKYHANYPSHFVFNLDKQHQDSKFVIVCEGPFDAMSVDGVSVQQGEISEQQADMIEALGREVIVVPDFDQRVTDQGKKIWPGKDMIRSAVSYGWSVSFPVWSETCKDINAAVAKYGKLFVLRSILDARESNSLKIRLRAGIKDQ